MTITPGGAGQPLLPFTLEKLRDSLRDWKHVVTVEPGMQHAI